MKKRKYRLKKTLNELVDDTLSMIDGDNKDHVNQNVRSAKTMDAKIYATTQPYSWNRRLGSGAEFYPDAYFSISEGKENNLEEQKALNMIEDILSKRSDLRDIDTPTSIPEFNQLQEKYPIISKHVTMLIDKIKEKEQELGEYGATILNTIMDSFNVDKIPYKVKKILINKLKGIGINNNI